MNGWRFWSVGILGVLPITAFSAVHYQITPLAGAGGNPSVAEGVYGSVVVGVTLVQDEQGTSYGLPTVWVNGEPNLLPIPSGYQGGAIGVNSNGTIVGAIRSSMAADPQPVLWTNSKLQFLNTSTFPAGVPYALNNKGELVGQVYDVAGSASAAQWTNGQITLIDAGFARSVNDSGHVLVSGSFGAGIWNGSALLPFAPLENAGLYGYDINNLDHVVGSAFITEGSVNDVGFIWKNGTTSALPSLPGDVSTIAVAINDNDAIVGNGHNDLTGVHALLWQEDAVFDLNDLIPVGTNWSLSQATDIDNDGRIIGCGSFNGQLTAFLLTPTGVSSTTTPTPEPATAAPLLLAATSLLLRRRTHR